MKAYQLTSGPVLIDIGKAGLAAVRCSVPFWAGSALHCAEYVHKVGGRNRATAVFRTLDGSPGGVLSVWLVK